MNRVILIDNYDSFTYNLYQYLEELGAKVTVKRNDEIDLEGVEKTKPKRIVISPGPGRPENAGISVDLVKTFAGRYPILGVCLGHQAICYAYSAKIVRAKNIMHGKTSFIKHNSQGIFRGVKNPFVATRYHSLVVSQNGLPSRLEVTAFSEDKEIMAVKVRGVDCFGIQFHPESILTNEGKHILFNFLKIQG